MKRRPEKEIDLGCEDFRLVPEEIIDWKAREHAKEQAEKARQEAAKRQLDMFAS